jgi:hypothetical protein
MIILKHDTHDTTLTGADRRTLDAIFRHPLAHNLAWREVVGLIGAIGDAEEKHNGEFVFQAGDATLAMKRPHGKDLQTSDVMDLRHFLTRAGWSPNASATPDAEAPAPEPGLIVVIDHAGARVYAIDDGATDEPKHLLHHLERKQHDADREETYPEDDKFFEQVANALATGGPIVPPHHPRTPRPGPPRLRLRPRRDQDVRFPGARVRTTA